MAKLHPIIGCENSLRKADVIFIHGIGDDWAKCWWGGQGAPDIHNFFPYWLGQDVPNIAVWSLEYEADRSEWTGGAMPLEIRATNVLDELRPRVGERPLLFVVHSLGGLVVKQVMRNASDLPDPAYRRILEQTRGILFFSTPHSGANVANWYEFLGFTRPTAAMHDLKQNTEKLQNLNLWLRSFYQRRKTDGPSCAIKIYYEERTTPLKRWGGLRVIPLLIVDRTSADPGITNVVPVGMDRDHLQICKPADRNDRIYEATREFVNERLSAIAAESALPAAGGPQSNPVLKQPGAAASIQQPVAAHSSEPGSPTPVAPSRAPQGAAGIDTMLEALQRSELSFEQRSTLIDAVLALPNMAQASVRGDIVQDLGPAISSAVYYNAAGQAHVANIVKTCLEFDGGLVKLHQALLFRYKNTIKYNALKDVIVQLYGELGGAAGS